MSGGQAGLTQRGDSRRRSGHEPPRRPCPACESDTYTLLLVARNTPIWQCVTCHLATWNWADFDPTAFYDESYWRSADPARGYADYFQLAAATARTHRKRLGWLRHYLSGVGRPRLVDAGCGPGFFVKAAGEAGFEAAGVEVSAFAVEFARRQLGQDVWQGTVRAEDLGSGPYEVATLWDVIEHLPDPAKALRALHGVLRPGGVLALSTGDIASLAARVSGGRWHLFNLPEHVWFFTPESLRRLLRRTGFEPVAVRYEVCWYTLRYLVERLEAVCGARRRLSYRLGRLGLQPAPVTLGDVVTVVARRRGH